MELQKPLLNVKQSRLAFFIEYVCGSFLLLLLVAAYTEGINVPPLLRNIVITVALIAIGAPEIQRFFTRYKLYEDKLVIIQGILKQNIKKVYYHPLAFVPDLNIKQTRLQRLLGIGSIYLRAGGGENTFEIKDVARPDKVLEMIEDFIQHNKEVRVRGIRQNPVK